MKLFKIIGFVDAILLIVLGVLYFLKIRFPDFVLPLLLSILIISVFFQNYNRKNNN